MDEIEDVLSLMLWIRKTGLFGDVYPVSDAFIWKKAGSEKDYFYCKDQDIYRLDITNMS